MSAVITDIFKDGAIISKIKNRLPYLFQLAELESNRAGKVGMEVGSVREKIIVALLIYKFGEEQVISGIPITKSEVDAIVCGQPVSIKTITGKNLSNVKVVWTVDASSARDFIASYTPKCDILLVQINWENKGYLYHIPLKVQEETLNHLGREKYLKPPKERTNPRGVEFTREALLNMTSNRQTSHIEITWQKTRIAFNPFKRWLDLWRED
jgi:hypothetical protein